MLFRACGRHHTSVFPFSVVQQSSAEPISVKSIVVFSDDSFYVQGYKDLRSEKYEQWAVVFCLVICCNSQLVEYRSAAAITLREYHSAAAISLREYHSAATISLREYRNAATISLGEYRAGFK